MSRYHESCGGTVLLATHDNMFYDYCARCRAFAFDGEDFPKGGVYEGRNRQAWDDGDERSPDPDEEVDRLVDVAQDEYESGEAYRKSRR